MVSTLRILHPPASENSTNQPLVVLQVDATKYLFNTPEGVTRSLSQRSGKGINKGCENVFVPSVSVDALGGLAGLIMTLADGGKQELNLHGPPYLAQAIATMRFHARRDELRINTNEAHPSRDILFKDNNVEVRAVTLVPNTQSDAESPPKRPRISESASSHGTPSQILDLVASLFPGKSRPAAPGSIDEPPEPSLVKGSKRWGALYFDRLQAPDARPQASLAYIVRQPPVRGEFDNEAATNAGVMFGPERAQLSKGEDITIKRAVAWPSFDKAKRLAWIKYLKARARAETDMAIRGKAEKVKPSPFDDEAVEDVVVRSADVMGQSRPGQSFVQLSLPSPAYIPSLLASPAFDDLSDSPDHAPPHVIIHASPSSVLTHPDYVTFARRIGAKAHHIVAGRDITADRILYPSAALSKLRLSHLNPHIWTPPRYDLTHNEAALEPLRAAVQNVEPAGLDTSISIQPPLPPTRMKGGTSPDLDWGLDSDEAKKAVGYRLENDSEKVIPPAVQEGREKAWEELLRIVPGLRDDIAAEESRRNFKPADDDVHVTALGTGSASPSKYRNVSGTLVSLPKNGGGGHVLLDCGENTYGQLRRRFGDGVDEVLRGLRVLFLSHIHGDHHMGTAKLLLERKRLGCTNPLYVISNGFTRSYLLDVHDLEDLDVAPELAGPDEVGNGVVFLDSEHLDWQLGVDGPEERERQWREASERGIAARVKKVCIETGEGDMDEGEASGATKRRRSIGSEVAHRVDRLSKLREHVRSHLPGLKASLGVEEVSTCLVDHRAAHCYGLVMRKRRDDGEAWSVAYSGDTRPCATLAAAAKGVELLVHEATMEDSLPDMARLKGHSTLSQAIGVARSAGARQLLLTHFSQRYPKLARMAAPAPAGVKESDEQLPTVAFAFDLATMRVGEMWKFERYRKALELLFDADEAEDDGADAEGEDGEGQGDAGGSKGEGKKGKKEKGKGKDKVAQQPTKKGKQGQQGETPATASEKIVTDATPKAASSAPTASVERRNFKAFEHQYVVLSLRTPRGVPLPSVPPSVLSIHSAVTRAAEVLHGVMGAAFALDVLRVDRAPSALPGREGGDAWEALLRAPASNVDALLTTLSSGIEVPLPGASDEVGAGSYSAAVRIASSAVGLGSAAADDGREWFRAVAEGAEVMRVPAP